MAPTTVTQTDNQPLWQTRSQSGDLRQFILRWWVWGAIALVTLVIVYITDFSDFVRGVHEGVRDSTRGQERGIGFQVGIYVGTLFALVVIFSILTLVAHLYYKVFHRQIFRNAKLGHIILYVLCLILAWSLSTDLLTSLLKGYKASRNEIKPKDFQELLATGLISMLFIYMIVYGFIADFRKTQRVQAALLQQKTAAELEALKAQVNPHFLFNTLNNLYGSAISEDAPRTADSIQQLAGIMRYVMQESQKQTTDIQNELRFIDDYIHLHQIRLPRRDAIQINTNIVWDEQPAQIAPLLLNPLIENAFKYGISVEYPSFIRIQLKVEEGKLELKIENSIHAGSGLEKRTGTGLANVRKRLELAYSGRYYLNATPQGETYVVVLAVML